ncbi:hypothetical protein WQ57_14775 [Mesobacillus campisalis]|uniref:Uncharacterized protein n=1 Tax=Mesobacillus campisalis TaxID=1408103 RepID=A0A0M2SSV4_9BACI|nr:hypothetical protein [Mesobacillus campisalis]KKK37218.1 hypothetical protein WQ57_14775 [Mesobacillus campisalis]
MHVTITIRYYSPAGTVMQSGTFPLRGRAPESIAYEWLQQIKHQVHFDSLISVRINEDNDITDKVKALERS